MQSTVSSLRYWDGSAGVEVVFTNSGGKKLLNGRIYIVREVELFPDYYRIVLRTQKDDGSGWDDIEFIGGFVHKCGCIGG